MTATTRFREQGSQTPSVLPYWVQDHTPPNSLPPRQTGSVSVGCQSGSYKSCIDVIGSGYRKTSDPSKWVANPFHIVSIKAQASSGSAQTSNVPNPSGWYTERMWSGDGVGYILGPLVPSPKSVNFGSFPDLVNVDRMRERVIIKCLAKINPHASQTWVTAAEGHKSVNMILDRAKKLAAVWRYCRQGNLAALKMMFPDRRTSSLPKRIVIWDGNGQPVVRKNGRVVRRYTHRPITKEDFDLMSDPFRLWLEFRYGWSPLVLDIQDTLKAIYAQELRDSLLSKPYERVTSNEWDDDRQVTPITTASFGGGVWTATSELTHKVDAHAYAKYQVSRQSGIVNRLREFGLFDVPLATWELVPFSFVVDWFVPIGDYLAAVQPKIGVKVLDSGYTVHTTKVVKRTLTGYTPSSTGVDSWPSPPFPLGTFDTFTIESKSRTVGLPIPIFPVPEVKLNFKRLTDAVALFKGLHRSTQRI